VGRRKRRRKRKRPRSTEEKKDEKRRTVLTDPRNLKRQARSAPSSAGIVARGQI
jgi:hypothetical protein